MNTSQTICGLTWGQIQDMQQGIKSNNSLPPMNGRIVPSQYEKNEWSRMANDAYSKDKNDVGHKFSMAATLRHGESVALKWFDELQSEYRQWLISGF